MGYNLYIGEAVVRSDMEDRRADVVVEVIDGESLGAPLNSTDDHLNRIYPSYSAWAEFCRNVGLTEVFFAGRNPCPAGVWWKGESGKDYEGLIIQHPGCAALTDDHYKAFVVARERYKSEEEYDLKRLDWLVWWTRWAIDNCKYPSFCNS